MPHLRPLLLAVTALTAAAGLVSPAVATTATVTLDSCDVSAHHEGPTHTGYSCSGLRALPGQVWTKTLDGALLSYPLIAGGKVYVVGATPAAAGATDRGVLYALDATSGAVLWGPVTLSSSTTDYFFAPAYDDGRVFVADDDGNLLAFDAATGAPLWSDWFGAYGGEPVARGGVVWIDSSFGAVAVRERSGKSFAQLRVASEGAAPAVTSTGAFLGADCQEARVDKLPEVVWTQSQQSPCGPGTDRTAYLKRDRVYFGDSGLVLSQDTGKVVGAFAGVPAFDGKRAYFATGRRLYAQRLSGAPLWDKTVGGTITGGPVVTDRAVYVATDAPQITVLDPATGHLIGHLPLARQVGNFGSPYRIPTDIAIGDGVLVVPAGNTLTAFG